MTEKSLKGTNIFAVNRYYWPDNSATSQHLTDLAEDLVEAGANVTIITSRLAYGGTGSTYANREQHKGVTIQRIWTSGFGRASLVGRSIDYVTFYISAFLALLTTLKRGTIVIAKTDPPLISIVAALAARLRGATLVNWCQDLFPEIAAGLGVKLAKGKGGAVLRTLRNWSLDRAALNVTLSDGMAEKVISEGIDPAKIRICQNWSPIGIHPIERSSNDLRSEWEFGDETVLGYSGNLGRAHCVEAVVDLVRATLNASAVKWLFIGGGAGLPILQESLKAEIAEGQVILKPYQDQSLLAQSLSVPDLHLISLDPACEGYIMPSKLYGVLAAGRGIIALGDPNGSLANIVRSEQLGHVIDSSTLHDDVTKVIGALSDPGRITQWGERARKAYEAKYSREQALQNWRQALTDLTNSSGQ